MSQDSTFTPGAAGEVINGEQIALSGSVDYDYDEHGEQFRRGQTIRLEVTAVVTGIVEVDKPTKYRMLTIRQFKVSAGALQHVEIIAQPEPRMRDDDGHHPGQDAFDVDEPRAMLDPDGIDADRLAELRDAINDVEPAERHELVVDGTRPDVVPRDSVWRDAAGEINVRVLGPSTRPGHTVVTTRLRSDAEPTDVLLYADDAFLDGKLTMLPSAVDDASPGDREDEHPGEDALRDEAAHA